MPPIKERMLKREGEIDRNEEEKRKEKITKAPTDSADSFLLGGGEESLMHRPGGDRRVPFLLMFHAKLDSRAVLVYTEKDRD